MKPLNLDLETHPANPQTGNHMHELTWKLSTGNPKHHSSSHSLALSTAQILTIEMAMANYSTFGQLEKHDDVPSGGFLCRMVPGLISIQNIVALEKPIITQS